jgi:hypothetical protein
MPLTTPKLDDRTFEQLVTEARARIPRYTPEWTNFNDSDPGMTLVKLHAWMTETILYRLNRLPELNYIKFLELLNVRPRPATAARAQLTFKLKKLDKASDPLVMLIPKNTQVGVNDPDLTEPLVFETDRTLTALNALLAAVIVPGEGEDPWELKTEYNDKERTAEFTNTFYPFGSSAGQDDIFLLGILLRPQRKEGPFDLDRFPEGELDLTALVPEVFETDADNEEITGPVGMDCLFPWQVTAESEAITWEAYVGPDNAGFPGSDDNWRSLSAADETAALTRSGHIYLEVPGDLPPTTFSQFSRAFWSDLGLKKPPTNDAELIADLNGDDAFLDPADLDWAALGLENADVDDITVLLTQITDTDLDYNALANETWAEAGYSLPPVPYGLTWFRARLNTTPEDAPQISQFLLNTVPSTAAVTRVEEIVGVSDGRPNQTYTLRRTPILVDEATGQPDLELEVSELGEAEKWEIVSDFFGQGPDDAVLLLDSESGTLTFGDGLHSRIPVAGAEIIARRYRFGGGAVGNAGAGTITKLKSAIANVDSITNVRAAAGGGDAESLDEVILRAPHDLRMRERAVTADDFADLAVQTPGVRIQRAYALPLTRLDSTTEPPTFISDVAGAVTVVILPENKENTPQPTEDQLRLVCDHLNRSRLITTELYVIGPEYLEIEKLEAEVIAGRDADLKRIKDEMEGILLTYFHPLYGGEDGRGWPFGGDVYFGNVYRQLLNVSGVRRVQCLEITPAGGDEPCTDLLTVPDGTLIFLPAPVINLKVQYDIKFT